MKASKQLMLKVARRNFTTAKQLTVTEATELYTEVRLKLISYQP